ncbi:MAG TPA: heavy metal-binding domain-containing protein, partial [Candidatus Krumholzibacteria bacterium]|nr:heavy metal-binding domain-containing protein [Candidatus Krumholzibacteria bacterium]
MSKNLHSRRLQKVAVLLVAVVAVLGLGAWLFAGNLLGHKPPSVASQLGALPAHAESKAPAKEKAEKKQLWTCGMHPNVIQDHPGNCPICGMKLVPLRSNDDAEAEPASSSEGKGKILFYRNP